MATVMEVLRELPDPVYAEIRAMVMALGPHATPEEMAAAVAMLSVAAREATLALLINRGREEILAAREAATLGIDAATGGVP